MLIAIIAGALLGIGPGTARRRHSHARHSAAHWKLTAALTIAAVPGSLARAMANRLVPT